MKQQSKNTCLALGALALGLGLSGVASAAVGQECHQAKMRHVQEALSAAGVSAETRGRIDQLHQRQMAQMKELRTQWKAKHAQLEAAYLASSLDQKQIESLGKELASMKANKMRQKFRMKAQMIGMLSAEQRQKFFSEMKTRKTQIKQQCGCPGGAMGGAGKAQPGSQPDQPTMAPPPQPGQPSGATTPTNPGTQER